jgi:hypothetical protein
MIAEDNVTIPPPGVLVEAQERANFEQRKQYVVEENGQWIISSERPGEKLLPDGSIDIFAQMTVVSPAKRRGGL